MSENPRTLVGTVAVTVTVMLFDNFGPENPIWGQILWVIVGMLWLWWLAGSSRIRPRLDSWRRGHPMISTLLVFILCGTAGSVVWRIAGHRVDRSVIEDPIIEISFDLAGLLLPISIEPHTTVQIVLVRESRKVELGTFVNSKDERWAWPTEESIRPPNSVGKIQLLNRGDIEVFNVSYSITFSIGVKEEPAGITRVPFNLPLHDLPVGQRRSFYVVNQSSFPAMLAFEEKALMQVRGETQRRYIKVQPRQITFFDKIPLLPQSFHQWSGDKILDPDQWKKTK